MIRRVGLVFCAMAFLGLAACGGDDGGGIDTAEGYDTVGGDDAATGGDTVVNLIVPGDALGACAKKSGHDCHEFVGAGYTEDLASKACDGADETFQWGASCSTEGAVGTCLIAVMADMNLLMYYYAYHDPSKTACDSLSGTWTDL